jgi:hypothetical protein
MKNKVVELLEQDLISEPEIVDLVYSMYKLNKLEIIKKKDMESICEKLGIVQTDKNVFVFDENNSYVFN